MSMTRIEWEDYSGYRRVEWRDLDKVESIRFGFDCGINGVVTNDIRHVAAVARAMGIPVNEMGGELPEEKGRYYNAGRSWLRWIASKTQKSP